MFDSLGRVLVVKNIWKSHSLVVTYNPIRCIQQSWCTLNACLTSMAMCQEPAWGTPPAANVMRKEASAYTKAGSSLRKRPVPEHTPKTRVCLLYSCSHLYLWLYGGLSPFTISLWGGVNLQFQLIKIPGRDKSVSIYKLLWRFSSLPERVHPAICDCLQPPNRERHEML